MPKKKELEVEVAAEETVAAVAPKTEFSVYTAQDGYVRTYSVEVQGERAEELAKEYAGKIGGSVR